MNTKTTTQKAAKGASLQKAWDLLDAGDAEGAKKAFEAAIVSPVDDVRAEAFYGQGKALCAQGNVIGGVKSYIEAIKINRGYVDVHIALGDAYLTAGGPMRAILECYSQAVAYAPENAENRQKLVTVANGMTFKNISPDFKGVLTTCLDSTDINLILFGDAWMSVITTDKAFSPLWKLSSHRKYDAFAKGFFAIKDYSPLLDPFFLCGLGQFLVKGNEFERWITHLRRALLELHTKGRSLFRDTEDNEFILCALNRYAFYTDYVLLESETEKAQVEQLRLKIEKTDKPALADIALYGCYCPPYKLHNAAAIEKNLPGGKDHVSQIPKSQISDYLLQQEIKKTIKALTPIKDDVSVSVREQYEEFPYPRWGGLFKGLPSKMKERRLIGRKAKILVAGCGTGQEALEMASSLPDADVLAVDLSMASLAYALMRAQQLGIKNITFRHADILALGDVLKPEYDYITSSGVLHHMKDPKAGWMVLNGLLKPGGLMRIALYSRKARASITEGRKIIAEKKIGNDADSIRAFRANIETYLKPKHMQLFERSLDYRSLPMVRDLLFHVQEHQFDLLEIRDILKEFGFKFLGFLISDRMIKKYAKFAKNDPDCTSFEQWSAFEDKHPDTFIGMYTFWCEKPA